MKKFILTVYLMIFSISAQSQIVSNSLTKAQVNEIERFIQKAMETAKVVPGLGIAIVKDGEVAYAHGFGFRDVEQQLPVTSETGFYLASKTKSFLGMTAAILEHRNQLDLDETIDAFYAASEFDASIDISTITLTQLLSHSHGLSNSGLQYRLAFIDDMSEEDFRHVLYNHTTARDQSFSYSNLGYNIMGNIIDSETGESWRNVLTELVLEPAGLNRTTPFMSDAIKHEYAYPYLYEDGGFRRLKIKSDQQMQSAGGMVSTPVDLAHWLILQMNNGMLDGKQVFPEAVMKRVHKPYVTLEREYYEYKREAYELGWYQADFDGERMIHHFGSFEGYMTHVSFLPDHGIGVVALSNELEYGGTLPHLVASYIYDVLLGKEGLESNYESKLSEMEKRINERKETTEGRLLQKKKVIEEASTNPENWAFQPERFKGTYHNLRLGAFEVEIRNGDELWSTFGAHESRMLPVRKNTFLVDWQLTGYVSPPVELTVQTNADGEIESLNWGGRVFAMMD